MGHRDKTKMKTACLILCFLAATAFADDLFKPVDEEVVLLEEQAEAEPSQFYGGMMNPMMYGMMNPMMMGMYGMYNPMMWMMMMPWLMGGMGMMGGAGMMNNAAASKASFLEEEVEAEPETPAAPSQFYDPMMMMGMYGMMNP